MLSGRGGTFVGTIWADVQIQGQDKVKTDLQNTNSVVTGHIEKLAEMAAAVLFGGDEGAMYMNECDCLDCCPGRITPKRCKITLTVERDA